MFLPTQLGHTLPDSIYHRAVISIMSHRLASCPMCRWKPLAPNASAEGRFNFIKFTVSLGGLFAAGNPSRTAAECFIFSTALYLILD